MGPGIWVAWALRLLAFALGTELCAAAASCQSQSRLAPSDPGLLHPRGPQSPAKGRAPVSAPLLAPSCKATGLSSAWSQGQGKVRNTPQVQPGQGLRGAEVPGVVDAIQASPLSLQQRRCWQVR